MSDYVNASDDVYLSSQSYNELKVTEGCWTLEEFDKVHDSLPNSSEEAKTSIYLVSRSASQPLIETYVRVENCKEAERETPRVQFPPREGRIERVNDEESNGPEPPKEDLERLMAIVREMNQKALFVFSAAVEKRKAKRKFKDLTQFLPATGASPRLSPAENDYMHSYTLTSLHSTRNALFACADFGDVSTSTLRHLCMGALFDAYRIYFLLVQDSEALLQSFSPPVQVDLQTGEKTAFLNNIQSHPSLLQVCQYSVNSKASSTAKSEIRGVYLNLLAEKEGTTALFAQELVPGFNYDNVASLDDVVQLVEGGTQDSEVESFRDRLLSAKPLKKKLKPTLSPAFLEKLHQRLAQCR